MAFPKRTKQFTEGFQAFEDKKPIIDNPYKEGSKEGKDWIKGWQEAFLIQHQDYPQG